MTSIPTIGRNEIEIRQIEDDLRNLRRRYGHLERAAWRVRLMFQLLVGVLAAGFVVGAIRGNPVALVVLVLLLVLVIATWTIARSYPEFRLMDYVGWSPEGYWRLSIKQTEAMAVEHMVAERMERLAKLKGAKR